MEDRKLNEKESLELITQMIRNTRRNLDAGSGNMFLLWGYVCVLLTLVVWAGVGLTQNSAWMWGFWGIPVVGYLLSYIFVRRKGKPVSLYIDKVLNEMWQFTGNRLSGGCVDGRILPCFRSNIAFVCHIAFVGQYLYGSSHSLYPVFGLVEHGRSVGLENVV